MKKITTLLIMLGMTLATFAQTARVQVIHNSADAIADSVDVYLNGTLLLNNFAFRTATPFIDAPAGVPVSIDIAPKTSSSSAQSIYNLSTTLTAGETYILIASGIVSGSGYSPATTFEIDVFAAGREAATSALNTDLLVYHGSTDAPVVDVYEATGPAELAGNLAYGNFAGYLELPTADYALQIRDETGTNSLLAYDAPLATLGLDGAAAVVVASGFLNPSANSNGAAFGLYVALPSGGNLVALPTSKARVQVIHNSADAIADSVDIYLNDALLLDNFAFRNATPFIDAPAGVPVSIDVAPKNSTSSGDGIYNLTATLASGETYVLIASGIVSGSGYSPSKAFGIDVFAAGREAAGGSANTDVLVYHGSTDAPVVDVYEATGPAELAGNLAYGNFAGYLELPTADYALQIRDETGTNSLLAYDAPLATLGLDGAAAVVVASGFLNPSANSNGAAFGLYVALPSGGNLVALPTSKARVQVIHNSADAIADSVDIYLNDALLLDNFAFRNATPFIDAPAGVPVSIDVAQKNSTSSGDGIYNLTATLASGETYVLVASGIVSGSGYSPSTAFGIDVFAAGRETAGGSANTDVLVYHGSTDAPVVDIYEMKAGKLANNVAYGDFAGYLELPNADYAIEVRDSTGAITVVSYLAPLKALGLDGKAITVIASGFLAPESNSNGPAFGLYAATAAGGELLALPVAKYVDFKVNMSVWEARDKFNYESDFVDIAGSFNGWGANDKLEKESNGIYGITLPLALGSTYDYKFRINGSWSDATSEFPSGGPNRSYTVTAEGQPDVVYYNNNAPVARVQVIHNSADAAAAEVDVYLNGSLLIDNFEFRTASPFIDAPAWSEIEIDIAPASSTSASESIFELKTTLGLDETYILIASGIVSGSGYSPATAFDISVNPTAKEKAPAGKTHVLVYHGSTDAPVVDVYEATGPAELINNLAYGDFSDYLDLPTADYVIELRDESGTSKIQRYDAPLGTLGLGGKAITVVASGFLNPAANSNGAAFGLWVALPSGGGLVQLPVSEYTSVKNISLNSDLLSIYPNPNNGILNLQLAEMAEESYELNIISISGTVVYNTVITERETVINVQGLTPGMYVAQLKGTKEISVVKFKKL